MSVSRLVTLAWRSWDSSWVRSRSAHAGLLDDEKTSIQS